MSDQSTSQEKSYLQLMEERKNLLFAGDNVAAEKILEKAQGMQKAGRVSAEETMAAAYL
jgi:hypothetical protein